MKKKRKIAGTTKNPTKNKQNIFDTLSFPNNLLRASTISEQQHQRQQMAPLAAIDAIFWLIIIQDEIYQSNYRFFIQRKTSLQNLQTSLQENFKKFQICFHFNNKMGATNSIKNIQHKIQHQRFQNATFVGTQQIEILARTTLDDYNTWKSNLKKINFSNKENILFPLNYTYQEEGWCSQNTGFVKITYDNYPFVFQEELQNRISLDKHLSEEQMWYLLYTLVSTAKDFSLINRKVGDIRPHNIFVNEAGQIRLAVCFSWPNEPTNLQKTMNERQITYLSPEQIEMCKSNKMQNLINCIVSESFSIGLTMLHAGLLFNFESIYNTENFEINKKILDDKIKNWMQLEFIDENNVKTSYSSNLKQIIRNLCVFDHQKRQKSTEIFALLQPHKEAILNIEPFQLKYKTKPNQRQVKPQISYYNHLEKSGGFPVYNYTQIPNKYPNSLTPISHNANYDWSTRAFTQVPVVNKAVIYNTNHLELIDRYAKSSRSPPKSADVHIKVTNTIGPRQSIEMKPAFCTQPSFNPRVITVKPFMSINEDINQANGFRSVIMRPLQAQVQKKVESRDLIQIGPVASEKNIQYSVVNVQKVPSDYDSSDFLRKIQEQIQKSKAMFPS